MIILQISDIWKKDKKAKEITDFSADRLLVKQSTFFFFLGILQSETIYLFKVNLHLSDCREAMDVDEMSKVFSAEASQENPLDPPEDQPDICFCFVVFKIKLKQFITIRIIRNKIANCCFTSVSAFMRFSHLRTKAVL